MTNNSLWPNILNRLGAVWQFRTDHSTPCSTKPVNRGIRYVVSSLILNILQYVNNIHCHSAQIWGKKLISCKVMAFWIFIFKTVQIKIQRFYLRHYIQLRVYHHRSKFNSAAKELIVFSDLLYLTLSSIYLDNKVLCISFYE